MKSKDEWHVEVYRKTLGRGWEKAMVPESAGKVMATPCVGGVEIRKFRVRIRVFPKKDEKERRASVQNGIARAVRRKGTIYFPTRRGNGSIVLKFQDVTDSIAFFDKLAELNIPDLSSISVNSDEESKGKEIEFHQQKKATKRERLNDTEEDNVEDRNAYLDLLAHKDEATTKRRKTEAMLYIVRLMHDEDFIRFVDQIEENLNSSDDGVKFLRAFQQQHSEGNGG